MCLGRDTREYNEFRWGFCEPAKGWQVYYRSPTNTSRVNVVTLPRTCQLFQPPRTSTVGIFAL